MAQDHASFDRVSKPLYPYSRVPDGVRNPRNPKPKTLNQAQSPKALSPKPYYWTEDAFLGVHRFIRVGIRGVISPQAWFIVLVGVTDN